MKRMLINATQIEERRLAIVEGQKLLDFETEIEGREQRKGNIYQAVVTRVEPALEACFVDYGEERHGFLPFKDISRQYFQSDIAPSQARIQDVIKEGQSLLIQVEKEERGNKGAAVTTFVSLAGRYVVLMPNNPRGGGVSRRIEGDSRAELKDALDRLEYPKGMSIIARTAGIGRAAEELQWDLNYLLKLWSAIDGAAKAGKGAFLIYQESSLVIRAIRDYFHVDMGDILVDTDDIYEQARQFMAHVMPEHVGKVKRYRDDIPLFSRFQIEHQIETAYARTVQLQSGGAIVIDHTEALVSVDVNSARAIRGGDIEETATRTNLEAADEVVRQMRLRDLGGLIVIDFIDMEESKNRRDVENRLRDALRQDRARVQFGSISKFGLMEMSRQRLRPALSESASIPCPRCGGAGHIRDIESSALQILRIIQEEANKEGTAAVRVQVPVEAGSYLLNEKRNEIAKIEIKQRINVLLIPNKTLETPNYKLERLKYDDARLDNMEASYKLLETFEDPSALMRRSQEPTNRQTPLIKGVEPDAPAPMASAQAALPKADPVSRSTRSSARTRRSSKAIASPVVQPHAEGGGILGWIKSLFGVDDAPATAPRETAQPAAEAGVVGRGGRRERVPRSPRGERTERSEEQGGRAAASTQSGDEPRQSREPRERTPRQGGPRMDRGGERREQEAPSSSSQRQRMQQPKPVPEESRPPVAALHEASSGIDEEIQQPHVGKLAEQGSTDNAGVERAERRGRNGRYGRGRDRARERRATSTSASGFWGSSGGYPMGVAAPPAVLTFTPEGSGEAAMEQPSSVRFVVEDTQALADTPAAAATTPVAMPAVRDYALPLSTLDQVANNAGLQWVHSDAQKVAVAQANMAAQPLPLHVPRERSPIVPIGNEPLVLVETQKDLAHATFAFDEGDAKLS